MLYEDYDYEEYDYVSTYIYELQSALGIEEYTLLDIKAMSLEDSIELALSNMVGKEYIGKTGKTEIAEAVGLKNKRARLITSIQGINEYLQENNIPFEITERRKKINGKKFTIYEVIEIDSWSEFTDEKIWNGHFLYENVYISIDNNFCPLYIFSSVNSLQESISMTS